VKTLQLIYILAYAFPVVNHPVQREISAFIDRREELDMMRTLLSELYKKAGVGK
jgi:hypothetical protein